MKAKSNGATQHYLEAITHFHQLSSECQVRLPVVKTMLGVSSSTVWRMVAAGKLTAKKITDRTTTFNVGEIRALITSSVEV